MKIIIPSTVIDFLTRLEVLLGLKASVHTNTLVEASNLIVDINRKAEIQKEQRYRNALEKISTQ